MTWDELEEIRGIVERICTVVHSTIKTTVVDQTPSLSQVTGRMMADDNMAHIATYSTALSIALDIARQAGATQQAVGRVRLAALQESPRWPGGVATVLATVRLSLAAEARVISAMTFASRAEANTVLTRINAAFNEAGLRAADDLDAGTYAAILSLQSLTVKFLTDQALRLPYIIDYEFPKVLPSLRMSQQVYGDATRSLQLINENKVVHPAFMPRTGRMLST